MLLLILLAGAVAPVAACEIVGAILRLRFSRRCRAYRAPFAAGLVVAALLVLAETRLDIAPESIGDTPEHALALAFFVGALPEEGLKLVGFLAWLWGAGGAAPRLRLLGAVAVAMGFDTIETWLQLWQWSDRTGLWLAMLVQRALLAAPMTALGGFVVGVWAAVTDEARGSAFARNLNLGFVAALVAHGIWDSSVFIAVGRLRAQDAAGAASLMVPGLLSAAAIGALAIIAGLRRAGGLARLRAEDGDER